MQGWFLFSFLRSISYLSQHWLSSYDIKYTLVMQKGRSSSFSMPYITKSRNKQSIEPKNQSIIPSDGLQGTLNRLPHLKMNRLLAKIGASADEKEYIPKESPEKRSKLMKSKWQQLKKQYFGEKDEKEPYSGEIDEIVMGCWKPGFISKKSVWKRYKENHWDLTYSTNKVLLKKV